MSLITDAADVLADVIRDQFELDQFVQQLDLRLLDIAAPARLPHMILEVVRYLAPRGRLQKLVQVVLAEMPDNEPLKSLASRTTLQPVVQGLGSFEGQGLTVPEDVDPACSTIGGLVEALDERMDRFGYMNAFKRLHDVLHGLHREYGVIDLAVQERMRDPQSPLSCDAVLLIQEWISDANESCGDLEFSECRPGWIESLSMCLEALSDNEPERWNWALVELHGLPAREMRPLNDRLVDNASRLNFKELSQCSKALLASLEGEKNEELQDLAKAVELFNTRCLRLAYLVKIHNLCQLIDERLSPLPMPLLIVASKLLDWRPITTRLAEINKLIQSEPTEVAKLGDILDRIAKTYESAERYQKASNAEVATSLFGTFREKFNDLFDATDKGILKNSSDIGSTLNRLASKLKARL